MIDQLKKYAFVIVIAILFTTFIFSLTGAIWEKAEYDDFCNIEEPRSIISTPIKEGIECPQLNIPESEFKECKEKHGFVNYEYDEKGCAKSYKCDTCKYEYDQARKLFNQNTFIVASILAVIAIIFGLYYPTKTIFLEWASLGFLLGGIMTLFIATVTLFEDLSRFTKPILIIIELILVLFIAYKLFNKKK